MALLSDKVVNSLNPKITIIISTLVVGIAFFIFVYNPLSASINGILANQDISRYGNGELKNVSPIIKYYKGAIESGSLGTTEIIVNAIQNYNAVIQLSDEKKKNVTDHNKDISDYNKFLLDNMSKLEKRNINSQSINIILASFYAMNDYEKAKIYMDKALSLGGDKKPSTLLSFAQISYQKGEIDKALEYAQKAYDLENSNEQAKSILESINSLQIVNKK
ncbi:MAG: tetratricopeptide repeat protein [Cyanobium sp. MAG06]|nr:tetratricopeptide repeat protein [Cyanobium sp. MAG06]